jgi:co-chaperonin GroES (HSP10)
MRENSFIPPSGSVYVTFTEELEAKTGSGIAIPTDNNPRRNMVAEVTEVGDDIDDITVGMKIIFNRSRAIKVKDGIYCVKYEFIEGEQICTQ